MLAVDRLIHAARLRDAFAATPDLASRKPLESQDRLSLKATVAALTGSGPLSRDMADIQLSLLPLLPGWPTGLRIVRARAPETGGAPDSISTSELRQFGAQTSQLASGDPLLIFRTADGSWFHARNLKPPHDWSPAADVTRPLLSVCVAALVDRFKDDGWRIVAQLAGDSRQRPGSTNESLLLAKLGLRMAEWLEQASEFDQNHPLKLVAAPARQRDPLPATEPSPIASTPYPPAATVAEAGSQAPSPADTWAELEAFLSGAAPDAPPPCKRLRTEDRATRSPASGVQAASRVEPARPALFSDQYIRDLLSMPGTPSPCAVPLLLSGRQTPVIDLTGTTSPDRF